MSGTVASVKRNVRLLTGDIALHDPAVSSDRLDRLILSKSAEMTGQVLPGTSWSTAALTLTVGALDKAFSSTAGLEYDAILALRFQDNGQIVERQPENVVEAMLEGWTNQTARPSFFYLRESTANVLTARFDVAPDSAYVLDALIATTPSQAVDDATVIPYPTEVLRAIEKAVAATAIIGMTDEQLAKCGINRALAGEYKQDAGSLVGAGKKREMRFVAQAHISPVVQ